MTRSMEMWRGFDRLDAAGARRRLIAAIAAGDLDPWSGRLLRAGGRPRAVRATTPEDAARQLRLRPYGDGDPAA